MFREAELKAAWQDSILIKKYSPSAENVYTYALCLMGFISFGVPFPTSFFCLLHSSLPATWPWCTHTRTLMWESVNRYLRLSLSGEYQTQLSGCTHTLTHMGPHKEGPFVFMWGCFPTSRINGHTNPTYMDERECLPTSLNYVPTFIY